MLLSLCLWELLLLLRLFVQLLLLIPGFHKASIADLRLAALCLLRGVHPHAEKRFADGAGAGGTSPASYRDP